MRETPAPFEAAAAEVTNRIAQATPKQVALICRKTFAGVEALLEPLSETLSDRAIKSVEDSADSLTKIFKAYLNLRNNGGVDNEILDEIKLIMPDLIQARSFIGSALIFLQNLDLKNNNFEYNKALPIYQQHIMNAYIPILSINSTIRSRPDIKLDGAGR